MKTKTIAVASAAAAIVIGGAAGAPLARASSGTPPSAAAFAALNPVTPLSTSTFADPPQNDMPWARWNFPPASATIAGLQTDIQDAYDHNIAGLEIGQGGVPTTDQLVAIYNKANSLGVTISLKVASALPDATYSNTDPYARRTLAASKTAVNAGANVHRRRARHGDRHDRRRRGLPLHRRARARRPASVDLDRSSVIDLTSTLTGTNTSGYQGGTTAGTLNWTAPASPAGAQWLVLTFRAVPFGTTPETLSPQRHEGADRRLRRVLLRPARPAREGQRRRLLRRLARERPVGRARGAVEQRHAQRSSRRARATTSCPTCRRCSTRRCWARRSAAAPAPARTSASATAAATASARTSTASAATSTRRTAWSRSRTGRTRTT